MSWQRRQDGEERHKHIYTVNLFDSVTVVSFCQTPRRQSRLFCRYYDNNHHPKFVIGPVKEEDEWDRPRIVRYHDIVSDKEMETVKELAKPRVSLGKVPCGVLFLHLTTCKQQRHRDSSLHRGLRIEPTQ